jgi:hypothetical protein
MLESMVWNIVKQAGETKEKGEGSSVLCENTRVDQWASKKMKITHNSSRRIEGNYSKNTTN